jgi:hypothetical protein
LSWAPVAGSSKEHSCHDNREPVHRDTSNSDLRELQACK